MYTIFTVVQVLSGIFASQYVARVLGIEIVSEAVQDAEANLMLNNILNMEVLEGDVGERLHKSSFPPNYCFRRSSPCGAGL